MPIQIQGANAFKTVVVGGVKEYTSSLNFAVVDFTAAPTRRKDFGGPSDNEVHVAITTYADYTDKQIATRYIASIYDLLTSYWNETTTLFDGIPVGQQQESVYPAGVYDVRPNETSPRVAYLTQGVPVPTKVLLFELIVLQRYTSPNGIKRWPPQ